MATGTLVALPGKPLLQEHRQMFNQLLRSTRRLVLTKDEFRWMLRRTSATATRFVLLTVFLASSIILSKAQSSPQGSQGVQNPATPSKKAVIPGAGSRYRPSRFSRRANLYYSQVWGVDSLGVKWTESGEVIKFTYRVLDADKAKMLNDKKLEPSLIDPQAGVKLVVPSLEKVGQLRQSSPPEAGKMYWMAFSNKGRPVKPGHRVNIVIGNFRAEGLVVE